MRIKVVSAAICFFLAACGGSSNKNDPVQKPTPTPPLAKTFSVKVIDRNVCGVETPNTDAKLVLHDDEFNVEKVINADQEGVLTFTSVEQNQDISIVYGDVAQPKNLKAISIFESPITTLETIVNKVSDTSNCSCESVSHEFTIEGKFQLPDLLYIRSESQQLYYSDMVLPELSFDVCKQVNGDWPMIFITAWEAPSATSPSSGFALNTAINFQDVTTEEIFNIDSKLLPLNVEVTNFQQTGVVDSFYNGGIVTSNSGLFVHENFSYDYHLLKTTSTSRIENFGGKSSSEWSTGTTVKIEDTSASYQLTLPEFSADEIIASVNFEQDSFDFNNLVGMDIVKSFARQGYSDGTILQWTIVSPLSGKLQQARVFDLATVLNLNEQPALNDENGFGTIWFDVEGFNNTDNYDDMISELYFMPPEQTTKSSPIDKKQHVTFVISQK